MLELMYATGMKVSEITAIKVSDINLIGSYLTCGDKQERNIPFGSVARKALEAYMDVRNDLMSNNENEYLFLNSRGQQLSRQGLWKILKGYAKKVGTFDINPNIIRNSFAAHMIENGADIGVVQKFLGHTDISNTHIYLTNQNKNSREVYMSTHPRA